MVNLPPLPLGPLVWPIKRSFRAYVAGLDDGVERAGGGLVDSVDGYVFTRVNSPSDAVEFSGWVHFTGWNGLLDVLIRDPLLRLEHGQVAVEVCTSTRSDARTRLATADVTEPAGSRWELAPRLTLAGANLLGGAYEPGAALDPLVIRPHL